VTACTSIITCKNISNMPVPECSTCLDGYFLNSKKTCDSMFWNFF
jgi:hypothetical protein